LGGFPVRFELKQGILYPHYLLHLACNMPLRNCSEEELQWDGGTQAFVNADDVNLLRKKYSTGDNVELLLYGSKEIRLEGNLHI
jgi:hypothetical protein